MIENIRTAEDLTALPVYSFFECSCGYHGYKSGPAIYVVGHRVIIEEDVIDGHLPLTPLYIPKDGKS